LFNATAVCFLLAAHNVVWFRKNGFAGEAQLADVREEREVNIAAVYLLPFLSILAASLVAQAFSSGFEWLYPLRLLAAVVVLWIFRKHYRALDWSLGVPGILGGATVFAMWLVLAKLPALHAGQLKAADPLMLGLASLDRWQRAVWLVCRVCAAVVTVPVAEELAFRGYLARRLVAPDVEAVSFRRLTLFAILASSLAFGFMHGGMWIAGAVAGLVFAVLAKWRGRIGEAVGAHAIANLMIAVWVLSRGDYSLW
jgi:exosortase E/protease (VPEID-CTERM system)